MSSGHLSSISFFLLFFLISVGITVWASRRSRSEKDYLVAGGNITPLQNGLAMSGEYLSASALLGMTGLLSTSGFEAYIYSIAAAASWPLILFLVADPVRRLGKFTLTDVLCWRLRQRPVRIAAATSSFPITLFYLIGQLVAGGVLVRLLFGLPYLPAVLIVSAITLAYVLFGGMLATTWVQVIKASLLSAGVVVLTGLLLARFGWSPAALFEQAAHAQGAHVLIPTAMTSVSRLDLLSLAIALVCGGLGMPQIMTRFFTVRDPQAAQKSALYATGIVGVFHLMVLLLGFGAMALVGTPIIVTAGGGGNMAVPLLAHLLGGNLFFGFISGVSFATVLAVIAGLTLASATTFSHDLWSRVLKRGGTTQLDASGHPTVSLGVARVSAVVITIVATLLALLFEKMNVAFLIGLSQAFAAASNFPVLMLALFWRRLTTAGAVWGMVVGVVSSLVLIILSPAVQVALLHGTPAVLMQKWWYFPLGSPAIVSVPLAFVVAMGISVWRPEISAQTRYDEMRRLMQTDAQADAPAEDMKVA